MCSQNQWDTFHSSCDIPEEGYDASVDPIIFESDTPTTAVNSAESIPHFGIEQDFGRQLLPLADGSEDSAVLNRSHDGFYYCRLKKALKKV